MHNTIFTTPILNTLLRALSLIVMRAIDWRISGQPPTSSRYILIGVPHTSNWDFALMVMTALILRQNVHWMGKDSLFPRPFKYFVEWMGGIAINRSKTNNTVEQMINHFNHHTDLAVVITPEGTRSQVDRWRSGFYHIAHGAGVPIVLGFIDAGNKVVGFGPEFITSGNFEADIAVIQNFYRDKQGIRSR